MWRVKGVILGLNNLFFEIKFNLPYLQVNKASIQLLRFIKIFTFSSHIPYYRKLTFHLINMVLNLAYQLGGHKFLTDVN